MNKNPLSLALLVPFLAGSVLAQDAGGKNAMALSQIRIVTPTYPSAQFDAGVTGSVLIEFTVTPAGDVTDLVVVESSPSGVFDQSAIDAVSQWKFSPPMNNGVAVAQRTSKRIKFSR
jgi:TonB family protein